MRQNTYSINPERLLEDIQSDGQRCYDCDLHDRIGVGVRGQCRAGNPDYPKADRSTCKSFIPKGCNVPASMLPNGAVQRR